MLGQIKSDCPVIQTFYRTVYDWDVSVCRYLAAIDERWVLDAGMRLVSRLGDGYMYALVFIAILVLGGPEARWDVLAAALGLTLNLSTYLLIKKTIKRPRPFESVEGVRYRVRPPDEFSFPSGHTSCAFVVAGILSGLLPALWPLFYFLAILIGFSRIYNGVHYPTDVIAGATMGFTFGQIALGLV